jgi:hypothetical protein
MNGLAGLFQPPHGIRSVKESLTVVRPVPQNRVVFTNGPSTRARTGNVWLTIPHKRSNRFSDLSEDDWIFPPFSSMGRSLSAPTPFVILARPMNGRMARQDHDQCHVCAKAEVSLPVPPLRATNTNGAGREPSDMTIQSR